MKRVLFLIPARGGSKGIAGKNLRPVGGIPLVGRAARVARRCASALGGACRVVCSTDDPDIALAAREWGAEIPFLRPAELASDTARTMDVVLHALDALGDAFDGVVLLQPTSPLTEAADVLGAIDLHERSAASVVSISAAEHPLAWHYFREADGALCPAIAEPAPTQRQAARATFRLNGAIYVAAPGALRLTGSFLGPATRGFVMPVERSADIDCEADLLAAEALLAARTIAPFRIGARLIGPGEPCFVIAEAGVNHNGDPDLALRLVDAAAEAGADAVKFQTFSAERLATAGAAKAAYQEAGTSAGESQLDMLRRLELGAEAHGRIKARCDERGILFLSTPFDEGSADFLAGLGVPAFKVSSGDLTALPFLAYLARFGLPLIVSTGMARIAEVDKALGAIEAAKAVPVSLLHCVSNYPANPGDVNLLAMETMRRAFGVPSGYSDHTAGIGVAVAAAALGAAVIEKHFTLDRGLPGPDHAASIEPADLKALVRGVREAASARGHGRKEPAPSEAAVARVARKSLVAACDIPAGAALERRMLTAMRPGHGMAPELLDGLVGRRARIAIAAGTLLTPEMLS